LKTIAFFTLLLLGFLGVITSLARPDIVQKKYAEILAPIDQYFAGKNAAAWNEAKETERATWMLKLHLPADCAATKTSIRELECRNIIKMHVQGFEQTWANKVSNGWKPDGASK